MKVTEYKGHKVPEGATNAKCFSGGDVEFYKMGHFFYQKNNEWRDQIYDRNWLESIELPEQTTKADDVIEHDNVNHPEHYQSDNGVECIDAIRAALGHEGFIAYCRGNTIKYNWRSGSKNSHTEDLKKGAWYSNRAAIEIEKAKGGE